jgi:hypothetical protein
MGEENTHSPANSREGWPEECRVEGEEERPHGGKNEVVRRVKRNIVEVDSSDIYGELREGKLAP